MQGEANELKLRVKNRNTIPTQCDVVVIGGGPAGSSVATALAQAGFDVVLFEKERFPRPQVGESIIPHMWRYTDMLGVSDAIRAEGFLAKAGGIIVWDDIIHQMRFSSFGYNDPDRVGLHVERDIFDNLLLQFSVACGANVFEEVAVGKVDFTDNQWPKVDYVDRRGGGFQRGAIACRYVVDGSGHAAVIARQLNARKLVSEEVNYLGIWGYYKNSYFVGVDQRAHPPEDAYAVKPVTFVTSFEDGWIWHIILRESTSVGLVINRGQIKGMGREAQEQYLRESVAKVPILQDLLAPATFIEGSMCFRPDYSYYSQTIVGDNFYCIGDAGAFVDPIFSQGVVAAFYNAATVAWAIKASFENESRRTRYSQLAERQMLQYYGFSRLLALGDFGGEGVDPHLVKSMMRAFPRNELELAMAASMTTNRSHYLQRMIREAGLFDYSGEDFAQGKLEVLTGVTF
ncbi:MAG: FAD-dependent oxidoreductase [Anaerolineae bacterium]|nr:FAD-dependent oxidoreductase [Anaerolineae bacterium]MCO5192183.1 FAD-dependent oxidoreductase [Anaerolineae bacterium]MCO5198383.1 FAD-dependent oxidoreductase [Anaerolineae bacterium]MCO5205790.1 FAD-dependent oxidoreductase [Anaerolineae bacterium]